MDPRAGTGLVGADAAAVGETPVGKESVSWRAEIGADVGDGNVETGDTGTGSVVMAKEFPSEVAPWGVRRTDSVVLVWLDRRARTASKSPSPPEPEPVEPVTEKGVPVLDSLSSHPTPTTSYRSSNGSASKSVGVRAGCDSSSVAGGALTSDSLRPYNGLPAISGDSMAPNSIGGVGKGRGRGGADVKGVGGSGRPGPTMTSPGRSSSAACAGNSYAGGGGAAAESRASPVGTPSSSSRRDMPRLGKLNADGFPGSEAGTEGRLYRSKACALVSAAP